MKPIIAILSFLIFSSVNWIIPTNNNLKLEDNRVQPVPCPADHKKAEQELQKYLSQEIAIESLRKQYNMDIDRNAPNNIRILTGKSHQNECEKLNNNLNISESKWLHSFYKVADHYFIVDYLLSENNEFEFKSITIVNNEFEVIGVAFNF